MESPPCDRNLGSIKKAATMDQWDDIINVAKDLIYATIEDKSRAYKLLLAYEELISNIVKASECKRASHGVLAQLEISVICRKCKEQNWLVLRTQDTGIQFDPHFSQRDPIDTSQPVHERQIGGLGIFLIEQSVDQATYDWIDGKNVYELCMRLGSNECPIQSDDN